MSLNRLLQVALKLLSISGCNHSLTEAICQQHRFDTVNDPSALADLLQDIVGGQACTPPLLEWLNILLFNICSSNEELIAHYENRMLESTGDAPKYHLKEGKMQASGVEVVAHVRNSLRKWLQRVVGLPFVQRILTEINEKTISKSKSLRSFLETLDYLSYKYQVTISNKQQLASLLASIDRKAETSFFLERASWTNKRVFSGAEQLVGFLNELADNYTINVPCVAALISANYFNANPQRKPFESAINCGEAITEETVDFLIRKCSKSQLFSQKMDGYRPFQLLMEVVFQKFSSLLIQFNEILEPLLANAPFSIYHPQNHKKIQAIASLFSYQLETSHPRMHHLLSYMHSSLLAKYTAQESLQLMKKFILNRLLLNPFYFALLNSPSEQEMERYVKVANEVRILFYEKKMDGISQQYKSARLTELGELLRNSLFNTLNGKESGELDDPSRCDKGVYINDTLLGLLYCEISDSLKGHRTSKPNSSEIHSESSLSFSLRNDSASRVQLPTNSHLPLPNSSTSFPNLPKSRPAKEESSQRNTSKIVSTDVYLQREQHVDNLDQLVSLRREYGEMRRQIEVRSAERANNREHWMRQLKLMHEPARVGMAELARNSSQLMIHSLLL